MNSTFYMFPTIIGSNDRWHYAAIPNSSMQLPCTRLCSHTAQYCAAWLHTNSCLSERIFFFTAGRTASAFGRFADINGFGGAMWGFQSFRTGTGELRRHFQFVRAVGKACGDDERQSGRVVHDIEVFRYFCFRTGRIGQSDAY